MKLALVSAHQLSEHEVLAQLVAQTEDIIAGGWIMKPPGIRDYIAEHYSIRSGDVPSFLLAYYARWLMSEARCSIILADDQDLTMLGLMRLELVFLCDAEVSVDRFRQELVEGFITNEFAQLEPKMRRVLALAMRLNPYGDTDAIIRHHDNITDQWRDSPKRYWGAPFPANGFGDDGFIGESGQTTYL